MDWKAWFLQLSGWPVFIVILMVVGLGMLGLSQVLTKLGDRSVARNAVLVAMTLAVLAFVTLVVLSIVTR